MNRLVVRALIVLVAAAAAWLPSTPAEAHVGRCGNCGTVQDVDYIVYERDRGAQGAVVGAIIGGLLGNQVGGGRGRDAATVAGAVAGGLIGRRVDKNHRGPGERGVRILIKLDRGGTRTIELHGDPRIYRGDRVRVWRDRVELL